MWRLVCSYSDSDDNATLSNLADLPRDVPHYTPHYSAKSSELSVSGSSGCLISPFIFPFSPSYLFYFFLSRSCSPLCIASICLWPPCCASCLALCFSLKKLVQMREFSMVALALAFGLYSTDSRQPTAPACARSATCRSLLTIHNQRGRPPLDPRSTHGQKLTYLTSAGHRKTHSRITRWPWPESLSHLAPQTSPYAFSFFPSSIFIFVTFARVLLSRLPLRTSTPAAHRHLSHARRRR